MSIAFEKRPERSGRGGKLPARRLSHCHCPLFHEEPPMPKARKARAIGFNHIALEVGDIEEALAFYRRLFDFELRGKSSDMAFIDLGDQFLALQKGREQSPD